MCLQIIFYQQRKKDYLHIRTYLHIYFFRTVLSQKLKKKRGGGGRGGGEGGGGAREDDLDF